MSYFVHPTAVIDEGARIGNDVKIWHFSHLMGSCIIGDHCVVGQNVFIDKKVELGNNVHVQNNVSLYEGVICEDDVFIGPSAVFTNVINPRSAIDRKNQFRPTIVRKGATIGANVTVVCGNEIGAYAFVGAGAVVTKPVKPYSMVIGNPSRHMGWISEYGHRLIFDETCTATCKESGQVYVLKDDTVIRKK